MAKNWNIKGVDKVIKNLNREANKIKGEITAKGFLDVAEALKTEMESVPPTVPKDTGNLRSSWFVTTKAGGKFRNKGVGFSSSKNGASAKDKQEQAAVVSQMRGEAKASKHPMAIFGFAASYAKAVHEMKDSSIKWTEPGSGPDFFLKGLTRMKGRIIAILKNSVK